MSDYTYETICQMFLQEQKDYYQLHGVWENDADEDPFLYSILAEFFYVHPQIDPTEVINRYGRNNVFSELKESGLNPEDYEDEDDFVILTEFIKCHEDIVNFNYQQ